jgi:peptidyl-prolyl cis-trans isomerase SurA
MKTLMNRLLPPRRRPSPVLVLLVLLFCTPAGQAEVVDRVVAEVNEDVITLSEVEEEGEMVFQRIIQEVAPEERDAIIAQARREVLESIIDKTLIAQEAAKQGVTVSEEELDAAIEQIIAANDITREILLDDLKRNGLDEQMYRDNLRSQIYQNRLVSIDVRAKVVVTEEMMLDYYDANYTRHVSEGGFYLLQIGTSWENLGNDLSSTATEADKGAALERAERIHTLAKGGQDFRDLARRFSDLPSAAEGGDIGVFTEDEMASYMQDAVLTLKAGEISPVVETPVGYQFFKLLSSSEGGIIMQAPYESVKEEIKERLYAEFMQKELDEWIDNIREQAYIRRL